MSNILLLNTTQVMVGLGTMTFTCPIAGTYRVTCDLTEMPPSSLSVVVNKNGSPVYTAPALSPTQPGLRFVVDVLQAAASDVITVVLSSSAPADNTLNSIKSSISIGNGQ